MPFFPKITVGITGFYIHYSCQPCISKESEEISFFQIIIQIFISNQSLGVADSLFVTKFHSCRNIKVIVFLHFYNQCIKWKFSCWNFLKIRKLVAMKKIQRVSYQNFSRRKMDFSHI